MPAFSPNVCLLPVRTNPTLAPLRRASRRQNLRSVHASPFVPGSKAGVLAGPMSVRQAHKTARHPQNSSALTAGSRTNRPQENPHHGQTNASCQKWRAGRGAVVGDRARSWPRSGDHIAKQPAMRTRFSVESVTPASCWIFQRPVTRIRRSQPTTISQPNTSSSSLRFRRLTADAPSHARLFVRLHALVARSGRYVNGPRTRSLSIRESTYPARRSCGSPA